MNRLGWAWVLALCVALTGCATPSAVVTDAQSSTWAGRWAMQVLTDPPQHFTSGFELRGTPQSGELTLLSPLGQMAAVASWSPHDGARLVRGAQTDQYPDMNTLTEALTGTALPLPPLFAWLQGHPMAVEGWTVDLSRHTEGRILATRQTPAPAVQLRIVLQ